MILIVLVILGVCVVLAAWAGYRRLARVVGGLGVLLFLLVACGPLPALMLRDLQAGYPAQATGPWAARNAIVLLGAGTARTTRAASLEPALFAWGRIAEAAMLYRQCKVSGQACLLLVSGGDSQHHGQPEAVVYAGVLRRLGVPAADIAVESRSMNTWQNAKFSRPLLLAFAPQRLLLVTSGIHLRRSLLDFGHFGMRPQPLRGDAINAVLSPWPLAWNLAVFDAALHEYLGVAQYYFYNAMGWNAPALRSPLIPATP